MKIIPFVRVGEVAFGSDPAAVIGIMGERYTRQVNRIGLTEIDYGTEVYRFDDDAVLVEITVGAPVLELDGKNISFDALADFLRANDPNAFERTGFMIRKWGQVHFLSLNVREKQGRKAHMRL